MTGYRSGFVAGDPNFIAYLQKFRTNPGVVPQAFVNAAASAAWSEDLHVAERRAIIHEKKQLFLEFLDRHSVSILGREATLYLWVRCPPGWTADAWAERLLQAGIVVSPGGMFGSVTPGEEFIRLAMVPDLEKCRAAIAVWEQILQEWK